ncbi:class I SAM-dependent methyltransferase [Paragemmobacter ruber]|uniref:Class I SAM-dependent methyltransferase n=1 Tax=Paragemmobacter ruber TaxID=1985673 RepID=A0ABW9Y966_9RHOB|nr:class I SAM-dependent methyltransferase [Rhodobacter ruber]NBE08988.1 class I SAM-dependent methyltransferase [Rhodobacter ruber]
MAIKPFKFEQDKDVAADIRSKYGFDGDLLTIYAQNEGAVVHKWHHYIPLYDRYFGRYRGQPVRFLELGVSRGGSLQIWRNYLGPEAILFGIDIEPNCAEFDGLAGRVRIGSQDDPDFLRQVVEEMGGVDVVLDDGSHVMDHIRSSLMTLFPHLSDGGLYVIEDLHTAYWPGYGGGRDVAGNFFNDIRRMVDDMHHWYHDGAAHYPALAGRVTGLHLHDSFVVLEKGPAHRPVHSRVGRLS